MRSASLFACIRKAVLVVFAVMATAHAQAGIYVDSVHGVDTNPGTAALPVRDISTAIALAQKTDAVVVANGTYKGAKNRGLDTSGKALNIRSLGGAANCIIDCEGKAQAFLIHSGETGGTQIIGFTIQNGKAANGADGGNDSSGNGLNGGDGASGGAIDIENSSPTIKQCVFLSNVAGSGGAGGLPVDPTVNTCGSGGQAGNGGAIVINGGSPVILDCKFLSNKAGDGGVPTVFSAFNFGFPANGGSGGAIAVTAGSPSIVNGLFVTNVAGVGSGAVYLEASGGNGGAISAAGGTLLNCTITGNAPGPGAGGQGWIPGFDGSGGGVYASNSVSITNCIVFNNKNFNEGGNVTTVADEDGGTCSYDDISNPGNPSAFVDNGHNIDSDPMFASDGAHLTPASPCLVAGNTAAPGLPGLDLDNQPRKQRGGVDLGAYELYNTTPTLSSLSRTTVPVGSAAFTLTLTGTNLNQTSLVLWNGVARSVTYVSPTSLTLNVAASDLATATTIKLNITNPGVGGGISKSFTLTVTNPKPTLTSLSPSTVAAGGAAFTLTLTGTNFLPNTTVRWNGKVRTATYVSATTMTVAVTAADIASPGTIQIILSNAGPGGGTSNWLMLTVAVPTLHLSTGALTRDKVTGVITVPAVLTNSGPVNGSNLSITAATLASSPTGTKLPVSLGSLATGNKVTTNLTFPGSVGKKGQWALLTVSVSFTAGTWVGKANVILP